MVGNMVTKAAKIVDIQIKYCRAIVELCIFCNLWGECIIRNSIDAILVGDLSSRKHIEDTCAELIDAENIRSGAF